MLKRRRRQPTLLGEAFAMKESKGWEHVADNIRIQDTIARKRRRLFLVLLFPIITLIGIVLVFWALLTRS